MKFASIQITPDEFNSRSDRLLAYLKDQYLSGVVLFDNHYILYFTGFAFIPTERPIAFVLSANGERALFVPRLEVEHAQAYALIDRVDYYIEYPHDPHPMVKFQKTLAGLGLADKIGADQDGYPWILGYRGPSLSELTGARIHKITGFIEDQMMIKSQAELALIRESVKWGHLAHTLLQRYTRVGKTETEVSSFFCLFQFFVCGGLSPLHHVFCCVELDFSAGWTDEDVHGYHGFAEFCPFAEDQFPSAAGPPDSELCSVDIVGGFSASTAFPKVIAHFRLAPFY